MLHVPDSTLAERQKYEQIWQLDEYKKYSPGLENVERFVKVIEPVYGAPLIDIGCGAGVAGLQFAKLGMQVTWLDLTDAGLSPDVDRSRFLMQPLWREFGSPESVWRYGFCCDVMEHIPTEYTMLALARIIAHCETSWIQISHEPDQFGQAIGKPLHLTVQPFRWWLERIASLGTVIDARDLCGVGLFVVTQ